MSEVKFETHYSVKCRMSNTDNYHVCGWAVDEENLKDLVDHLKKTWRYVEYNSYRSRVCEVKPEPSKRKKK